MQRQEASSPPESLLDIRTMLRLVRQNLGLDVAFIGEFVGERRIFRHVDAAVPGMVCEGEGDLLEETYCQGVVGGRLPELIPDTDRVPEAQRLAVTRRLPVGSHLSVPIRLSSGMVYGTFCCFGHRPDHSLTARDLAMLRIFAGLVAQRIDRDLQTQSLFSAKRRRVRELLDRGGPSIVFQPVFLVDGPRLVGSEALSRFPDDPHRPVESWFEDAAEVGCAGELEHLAIRNALDAYRAVWARHPIQLGLNASPSAVLDPGFPALFADFPADRIVLELTEHEKVEDYAPLLAALEALRALGMRVALDDVGSGYAGMTRVVAIRPDIVKLDRALVRGIDADPMCEAMAAALIGFADRCGCHVVAEGVETPGEFALLARLKVQAVQGWLLGRPMSVDALLSVMERGTLSVPEAIAV